MAELADALDSKSSVRKDVWVRVPPLVLARESSLSRQALRNSRSFVMLGYFFALKKVGLAGRRGHLGIAQ